LASFSFDQAEGLRRMLAGPRPRIITFLSVLPEADKSAMLVNIGASLAAAGSDTLLLDANLSPNGVAARLGAAADAVLMQVARQQCNLEQIVRKMPQGFRLAALACTTDVGTQLATELATHRPALEQAFQLLAQQNDIVLVDAALDTEDRLPLPAMASSEVVVQVSTDPASITAGYALIKRLNAALGRRPFGVLVSDASEQQAQLVFHNMALAANRYLALPLHSIGSVPADAHIKRASGLGRAVVEAFPLAGASVAFRRLAGRLALSEAPSSNRGILAGGANRGA
jgi:flagellar biosynthesis protein FlhG